MSIQPQDRASRAQASLWAAAALGCVLGSGLVLANARPTELREATEATREILGMMLPRNVHLAFGLQDPEEAF